MKTLRILFFVLPISLSSCGDKDPKYCNGGWDTRLEIINNSNNDIYVMHSAAYPDTSSYSSMNNYPVSKYSIGFIFHNTSNIHRERCTWDDFFRESIQSDTLMIFIILDEGQGGSLHVELDQLKEHHTVLKRFDLTLQNLEAMNWTITYP